MSKPVYEQSAVIPYRIKNDKLEILLITSLKKGRWIIPKGIVEEGMSEFDSAAKEAIEEAGVVGKVQPILLGQYEYEKWGGICRVKVYPLKAETTLINWLEEDLRERSWMNPGTARNKVYRKELKTIIDNFIKIFSESKDLF